MVKLTIEFIQKKTGCRDVQSLTKLDLSNNRLTDISALAGLTQLTALDLSGNQLSNILTLAELARLDLSK